MDIIRFVYHHSSMKRTVITPTYTVVPQYPQVTRSKTYRGYVKPQIIPNTIYNVIFV
jgi:hypothetical protein